MLLSRLRVATYSLTSFASCRATLAVMRATSMHCVATSLGVGNNKGLELSSSVVADFGLHTGNTPIRSNKSTSDWSSAPSFDFPKKDNRE